VADEIAVTWPDGHTEKLTQVRGDRLVPIKEKN